jgi:hypothetical protein
MSSEVKIKEYSALPIDLKNILLEMIQEHPAYGTCVLELVFHDDKISKITQSKTEKRIPLIQEF